MVCGEFWSDYSCIARDPGRDTMKTNKFSSFSFPRINLCLVFVSILLIPGSADDSSTSSPKKSGGMSVLGILLICFGIVALSGFSFIMYKLWLRRKREEQHARLLKLFEQDDELELELGIRD